MAIGLSIGACARVLSMQVFCIKHFVVKGDITALLYIVDTVAFIEPGLLSVVMV